VIRKEYMILTCVCHVQATKIIAYKILAVIATQSIAFSSPPEIIVTQIIGLHKSLLHS